MFRTLALQAAKKSKGKGKSEEVIVKLTSTANTGSKLIWKRKRDDPKLLMKHYDVKCNHMVWFVETERVKSVPEATGSNHQLTQGSKFIATRKYF